MAEKQAWERLENEPNRWFQRFELFRLLGPNRSIAAVYRSEVEAKGRKGSEPGQAWYTAAADHRWLERAEAWDKSLSDQVAEKEQARRIKILTSGFAQKHERVRALNQLARLLNKELKEEDKRWLPDVKSIGVGENAERVDIVHFNSAVIEQVRKSLEDIAAELGDRKQGVDITSGGEPLKGNDDGLSDDERAARIAAIFDAARERRTGPAPAATGAEG